MHQIPEEVRPSAMVNRTGVRDQLLHITLIAQLFRAFFSYSFFFIFKSSFFFLNHKFILLLSHVKAGIFLGSHCGIQNIFLKLSFEKNILNIQ